MNADAFRHFYAYHRAENRKTWDHYIVPLPQEQFTQAAHGRWSVRDQIAHLVWVEDTWFSGLRGEPLPEPLDPAQFEDRGRLRAHWDAVEQKAREYLAALEDHVLLDKPLAEEDEDLLVWQVLLHVVNHGTDHRAQLLRVLEDLGVETGPQDYIFYVYENP